MPKWTYLRKGGLAVPFASLWGGKKEVYGRVLTLGILRWVGKDMESMRTVFELLRCFKFTSKGRIAHVSEQLTKRPAQVSLWCSALGTNTGNPDPSRSEQATAADKKAPANRTAQT